MVDFNEWSQDPFALFCGVSYLGYNSDLHFQNYLFI